MAEEREASVQLPEDVRAARWTEARQPAALAKKVSVRTMPAGRVLFKEGDTDKRTVYLVSGVVELQEDDRTVRDDPRRHARSAQSARPADSAPLHRARGGRDRATSPSTATCST